MYLIQSVLEVLHLRSTNLDSLVASVMDSSFLRIHIMKMNMKRRGRWEDTAALQVYLALQLPNITDFFWRRHGHWPVHRPVSMSQEMTSGWPVNGTCVHLYIIVAGVRQRLPWHPAWLHMSSSGKRDGWWVFWAMLATLFCEKQSCGWHFSLRLTLQLAANLASCLHWMSDCHNRCLPEV